ncbi:coproporphyrinogen-III oxidase family protein [Candidatus Enterococcus ikei]|uniref:Heme chaperone HemW n=1 Tax=Candidatus Enterococcus ikei TaxID=2815326 RepID=A0ABS3GV25_9ENTE|nr:coproporphyrinogen-III oxidase family protein [Enterococcus sp. DIV0869a]MBO0439015.1 coproporphyrinogen III oxidase family protein [Enterococcus sp. DIV0869a]
MNKYSSSEILDYDKRGDCYTWCYPLDLSNFNTQNIWSQNEQIPKLSDTLTLYVHIPYCKFICSMCPFTHEKLDQRELDEYVEMLIKEISTYSHHKISKESIVTSIYFGGGTASLLSPYHVEKILSVINWSYNLASNCEITLECHPNTVDNKYLEQIKDSGINRVSFGIQSFQKENIEKLGLLQIPEKNIKVISDALGVGFNTVACDIMYNLPEQSIDNLRKDLEMAVDLGIQGLSVYALDPEVRQLKSIQQIKEQQKIEKEMFYYINTFLTNNDFVHVAQPDYSKKGHENRQIRDLWGAAQSYNLSFGAGAFSESFNGFTWANIHDPKKYIELMKSNKMPILMGKQWDINDAMSRYLVLGARCLTIPLDVYQNTFGIGLDQTFKYEITRLEELGYVKLTTDSLEITKEGMYYIDNISKTFFSFSNRGLSQFWGCSLRDKLPERFYEFEEESHKV